MPFCQKFDCKPLHLSANLYRFFKSSFKRWSFLRHCSKWYPFRFKYLLTVLLLICFSLIPHSLWISVEKNIPRVSLNLFRLSITWRSVRSFSKPCLPWFSCLRSTWVGFIDFLLCRYILVLVYSGYLLHNAERVNPLSWCKYLRWIDTSVGICLYYVW